MELVFKALGDWHRRLLLDCLLERDGQTLGELDAALPSMTRFGVMKHLGVLQTANLVTVRRVGRRKLHYLNPAPIQLVPQCWSGKYALADDCGGGGPRRRRKPGLCSSRRAPYGMRSGTVGPENGRPGAAARPAEQRLKL